MSHQHLSCIQSCKNKVKWIPFLPHVNSKELVNCLVSCKQHWSTAFCNSALLSPPLPCPPTLLPGCPHPPLLAGRDRGGGPRPLTWWTTTHRYPKFSVLGGFSIRFAWKGYNNFRPRVLPSWCSGILFSSNPEPWGALSPQLKLSKKGFERVLKDSPKLPLSGCHSALKQLGCIWDSFGWRSLRIWLWSIWLWNRIWIWSHRIWLWLWQKILRCFLSMIIEKWIYGFGQRCDGCINKDFAALIIY